MSFYKLEVMNSGAEYTYGMLTEKDNIFGMKKAIEEGEEITSWFETENEAGEEIMLDAPNNTQLLHVYGPCVLAGERVKLQEIEYDKDSYEVGEDMGEEIELDTEDINYFTTTNPYANKEFLNKFEEDALQWGTQKIEKRIHYPVILELKEGEEFEIKNLFFGSVNMDETMSGDEILEVILYINPENQLKIAQKIEKLEDLDISEEVDFEYFTDVLYEHYEDHKEIFQDFVCEVGDIEGKGEWENNRSIVLTKDGETLYEGDEY